jgi:uncharacterized membrane protein
MSRHASLADLIVIEYDDIHKAEAVRLRLQKMQRDYLFGGRSTNTN